MKLYAEGEKWGRSRPEQREAQPKSVHRFGGRRAPRSGVKGPQPKVYAIEISRCISSISVTGLLLRVYSGRRCFGLYPSKGYGFDDAAKVSCTDRGTADPLRSDFCIPDGTAFTVDLPDGQYQVQIITGDARAKTNMDVRANGMLQLYSFGAEAGGYNENVSDSYFRRPSFDPSLNGENNAAP
ncbi:hypothetical protein PO124_20230 [Bacillus licheniformis]|nr:hypothetical protein [Bacillus licheniformis]